MGLQRKTYGWRKTYERPKVKQIGTNCMHIRYFLTKQLLQLLPLCLVCGDSTFKAGQVNCIMVVLVLNGSCRQKRHKGWICSSAKLLVWLVITCGARDTWRSMHSATAFSRPEETCVASDGCPPWLASRSSAGVVVSVSSWMIVSICCSMLVWPASLICGMFCEY